MAVLKLDLRIGESLQIGGATVTLEQKSGQLARLVIDADKSIPVKRLGVSASMQVISERGFSPSPA